MLSLTAAAGMAGCSSEPSLQPTAPVDLNARVRALPAGVDLVVGIDMPAVLVDADLARQVVEADVLGIPSGLHGLDQVVVGCGDEGCVGLVDGSVDQASLGGIEGPSERLISASGWQGRLDRLGEGKLIVGDLAAVRATRRAHREGRPRLDTSWLEGTVPEGPIWLAARDPGLLHGRSVQWLRALGLPELTRLARSLEDQQDAFEALDARVERVAVAVRPTRDTVVVRLNARGSAEALQIATLLRARRPRGVVEQQVVQQGTTVEAVLKLDRGAFAP